MFYFRDATEFEIGSKQKSTEHEAAQPDQLVSESVAHWSLIHHN